MWVLSVEDAADAQKKASDDMSNSSEKVGDASEEMSDTVKAAAKSYVEAMAEMKNADPSDIIRDQLAAAAAEVQSFKDTIQAICPAFLYLRPLQPHCAVYIHKPR